MAEQLDLLLEKIEFIIEGQAGLRGEVAELKEGQAELRAEVAGVQKQVNEIKMEMGHMQAALFELLDGQKELTRTQDLILHKVDILSELYGRHEVEIRKIKEVVGITV